MKILLTIRDDGNGELKERTTRLVIETGDHGVDIRRDDHPRMYADRSVPVDVFQQNGEALTLVVCVGSADG